LDVIGTALTGSRVPTGPSAIIERYRAFQRAARERDESGAASREAMKQVHEHVIGAGVKVRELAGAVATAGAAVEERVASIEALSANVAEVAGHVDTVSASIGELAASVAQVAENAHEASARSSAAEETAREGSAAANELLDASRAVADDVVDIVAKMKRLNESSDAIGAIVEAIDGIARQTNLLALNAAIEAARAGDRGRGFAVVAEEVRKLADNSASATREIGGLVKSIRAKTSEVVRLAQASGDRAGGALAMADAAAAAMAEIATAAHDAGAAVKRISFAVREQGTGASAIGASAAEINELMQRSALSLEEQTTTNRDLMAAIVAVRDQAQHVGGAIARQEDAFAQLSEASAVLIATSDEARVKRTTVDARCDALEKTLRPADQDDAAAAAAFNAFAESYRELDAAEIAREADAVLTRAPYQTVLAEVDIARLATADLIGEIGRAASAVEEMVASVAAIGSDVGALGGNIDTVGSAIAQFAVAAGEVAEAARDAAARSSAARRKADEGAASVDRLIKSTRDVSDGIGRVAGEMDELRAASQRIGTIVDAIDEIADQTNLLALNAAIEAARAGDDGRGFAVVADEVRKLAESAGRSTREITELVGDVRLQIAAVVDSTTASGSRAAASLEIAAVASSAMTGIASAVADGSKEIEQISIAAAQQAVSSAEIVRAAERMRDLMRETELSLRGQGDANEQLVATIDEIRRHADAVDASGERQRAVMTDYQNDAKTLMLTGRALRDARAALNAAPELGLTAGS
jgi:methyl-accepting chemotaxis protein